jgi:hypothetical protein
MKTKSITIATMIAVLMVGCGEKKETPVQVESWSEKMTRLKNTPEVSEVGVFEGCRVSFVDRGQASDSFFLAKCPTDSATTTKNWETHGVRGGKTEYRETTVMRSLTEAEQKAFDENEKKMKIQKLKDSARSKLTSEELNALLVK